jgi:hypothetical protein
MSEWDARTKPVQTEWHKQGVAQQGWTDLDTGSVGGLERERLLTGGERFRPDELKEADKYAKDVRADEKATDEAVVKRNGEIDQHAGSPERQLEQATKVEADAKQAANGAEVKVKEAQKNLNESVTPADRKVAEVEKEKTSRGLELARKAAERAQKLREAAEKKLAEAKSAPQRAVSEEQLKAQQRAEAAAWKTVREAAVRRADAENKARVVQAARDRAVAQIQLKNAERAQRAADKVVREAAIRRAKLEMKVKDRVVLNEQAKAAQAAQDVANKVVRDAAVARAEAENKARVAQAVRDKQTARVQIDAAKRAEAAAMKRAKDAAVKSAAAQRKLLADPTIPVWEKVRQYMVDYEKNVVNKYGASEGGRQVPSAINFDDLRNKVAADLGMSVEKVTRLIARTSPKLKGLMDDAWLRQQRERNTKTKAKLWVQGLDMPAYEKFIHSLPRVLFGLRVGFHGTVALGTHAPAVAFDPRFWGTYVRNFGKMYGMVLKPSFYEAQMSDLLRRQNYPTAVRAGLVVDPFKYETFERPGLSPGKVIKAMSDSLGLDPKWFERGEAVAKMGERGYSVLKTLRMDMFDQHWDALPKQMRTADMAKGIADAVNHITGVVQMQSPAFADIALFAPKLQMSRMAYLFGDPMRAVKTGVRVGLREAGQLVGIDRSKLPRATPAEQYFAVNELKSKIITVGTLGSLLALNQGILANSDSKQSINLTDPYKSDFAKFKIAGTTLS